MRLLQRALVLARFRAYETDPQLAALLDAVHNLPDLLLRWPEFMRDWVRADLEALAANYPEWKDLPQLLQAPADSSWHEPEGASGDRSRRMTYNDEYPTCDETYATLCVLEIEPAEVTATFGLEPSRAHRAGEPRPEKAAPPGATWPRHGWFLCTRDEVRSRDVRHHVDWLLDRLARHAASIRLLRDRGAKLSIPCYWRSAHGHGGPALAPAQMRALGALEIDVWFDVYFVGSAEKDGP